MYIHWFDHLKVRGVVEYTLYLMDQKSNMKSYPTRRAAFDLNISPHLTTSGTLALQVKQHAIQPHPPSKSVVFQTKLEKKKKKKKTS